MRVVLSFLLVLLTLVSAGGGDLQLEFFEFSVGKQHVQNTAAQPVIPGSVHLQGDNPFCLSYYTGTIKSTWAISNPAGIDGLEGFEAYSLVNVDQRVLSQSPTSVEIEITIQRYVDTHAEYPVDTTKLPEDLRYYLLPEPRWIQCDDPQIIAKASELVSEAAFQVEAVESILSWVRAKVAYDFTHSLPSDALSVFHNRKAVCAGFSTLSIALLRAAGIPARLHVGCLTNEGWLIGIQGARHGWIEIYFPDVGWVASEPQATVNFVDTSHIFGGFRQCGQSGTIISRTSYSRSDEGFLYSMRTPYTNAAWHGLEVAYVPAMGREFQLEVTPSSSGVTLSVTSPVGSFALQIEDLSCRLDTAWTIATETSWLHSTFTKGVGPATVPFSINATGMQTGIYTGTIVVYDRWFPLEEAVSQTMIVNLWLTGLEERLYLPLIVAG